MDGIDERVRLRMGYDDVVACREVEPELPIHVALRGPSEDEPRWTTISQVGCDPDVPEAGSSGIQTHETERQARDEYARMSEYGYFAEDAPPLDEPRP